VAILMVLAGGLVLLERAGPVEGSGIPPFPQEKTERMGHGDSEGSGAKYEAAEGPGTNNEAAHG
jgi:hypothetical protein